MKLILFFFFLWFSLAATAQENHVQHYEYKLYRVLKTDANAQSNRNSNAFIETNKMDTLIYNLLIDKERASFRADEKISNSQIEEIDFSELMIESFGSYFYDFADSVIYNTKEFNGRKFSIKHGFDYIDWQMSSETEILNGYNCKIATYTQKEKLRNNKERDYTITVWFSDEVNSDATPFGLVGLPGGIIKINFNRFVEAILSQENFKSDYKAIQFDRLGKVLSQEEYDTMREQYFLNQREFRGGGVDKD